MTNGFNVTDEQRQQGNAIADLRILREGQSLFHDEALLRDICITNVHLGWNWDFNKKEWIKETKDKRYFKTEQHPDAVWTINKD